MNTRDKGNVAEGIILATMLKLGFAISLPFGGSQRYDIVVEDGEGRLLKAQCKTGRFRNGAVEFNTCSVNGFTRKSQDYKEDVDIFLVWCPDINRIYRVPVMSVGKKQATLRIDGARNGQSKGVLWAKDFEIAG